MPQNDPLGILGEQPPKKQADPLGILKKKEVSGDKLGIGGEAGISAPPSDSGKGFGELKPAKRQPAEVIKEPKVVGEDTLLARKMEREQRPAVSTTGVRLPAAPKVVAEEKAAEKALAPKLPTALKEDIGELEGLSNAIDRGILQGKLADMLALGQMPKREDIKEIARINKELTQIPSTGAYQRFNAAPNLKTAAKEFVDNPFEITSQLIGESLSALVRHGYSRALAGAGTGAALGSLIPIPGISTAAGAGTGYIAGMGVAGYNLEMASSIMDSFREAGVDITDEKSLTKAFDDPNTLRKAREFANKRAVPIAIFDMFSAGMGGKLLGKPAKTILSKVGRGAAEVGIQMGMAGAGETAAQLTAGQKINPTAILAEVIGEAGGGAPDIIVGTMIENKKNNQSIRKEAVRLDIEPQQLQDMLDISEASGEITDAQANEIKKEYEDIQKVKQAVPEEFKKNADVIEALEQKRQLEAKKQGLDPVFAKKIDEQIKAFDTKIDDIVAAGEVAPEMVQYTMEAPRLAGEPEQISKPIELSIEPQVPAAPAKSRVKDAIDKYDEGDISTINDLVDEIEAIADEEGNQVVLDAVEEYREEQRYNESLKGRGDMDAAEDAFLSKIRGVGEATPEVAPEIDATTAKLEELGKRQIEIKGKGTWRQEFNKETDPFRKASILRAIADGSKNIEELNDVKRAAEGMPEEGNIVNAANLKLKSLGVEVAPEVPAAPKPTEKVLAIDKRTEAKNQLRDAFNDLMNLGVAYDPRSQAEKQVRLTKAIINVIKQEAIGAIKDLQKYIKDNLGFDISDKDAKYLLTESKKPEYAIQEPTAGEVPVQPEARVGEEVAAGVPPTEPPKAPEEGKVESEEKRVSGIKKALVSKEVLESVDLDRTGDKQLLMAGRQIIESGEVEPKLLVDKIIDEGRGVLSPAEVVAMITYKADLDTKIEDLTAEIEQLEASGQDIGTKGVELKNLQVDQRNFEIAAVITAQQQSMSFRLRRWMLDRSYNLQTEIARYKRNNNGVIPEDVQKKFEEYDAQIQELKKKIREAETRKADQEGEQAAANIVEDVQREGKTLSDEEIEAKVQEGVQAEINKIYEQLPAKRKSKADQAIAALEKIQKRLRSRTYDASIGIPVAIIDTGITAIKSAIKAGVAIEKAIQIGIDKIKQQLKGKPFENEDKFRQDLLDGFKAEGIKTEPEKSETPSINDDGTLNIPEKFLRDLVRGGVTTIDGMTDAVFKELEPQLPGLTKRQVRDSITEYGRTVNPTKDEIREQVNTAKRLGRLISELEDLQTMGAAEFALKYFKKKPSRITEAEKNLKGQIRVLAKKLKTDPQRLAEAKEAAKRRIEELQRRLKEGDFSRREKPVIKADAELEILVGQKEALQDKFDEEQKKAELKNRTTLQKLEDVALEIFSGIPRALVAGFDLSAAFVQGTFRVFTNPVLSAKAFAEGIRQFASQGRQDKWLQRLRGTYNYTIIRNSGLAITDPDGKLSAKEQIFVVNWANTIYDTMANIVTFGHKPSAEFIKRINPLKASQRAFDGYVNYIRVSTFLKMAESLKNDGYTPDSNPEVYKKAADWINTSTGRANLGALEGSSKWLSTIFFAPRKVLAELKLFTPYAFVYYSYLPAPVRKRALTDFAKFATSVLVTHLIIKAALETYGEEEKDEEFWNPDSPNFLSFKIGEKRLSFLGGSKATLVFMSRLLVGNEFVDQYGVETKFGERVGKKINTKFDLIVRYFAGKASPSVGAIRDYTDKNPNYENDDEIFQNLVIPMWLQDSQELYKEDPIAVTGMFNALAIIGANVRKVDVAQVQDQIVFKEKVNKKEVKRTIKLTDAQKEEFQNIVDSKFKAKIAKISKELKSAQSQAQRAEYTKLAADMAKKEAQDILEKRYKIQFRQFPIQEKEQDVIREKVKKKLK